MGTAAKQAGPLVRVAGGQGGVRCGGGERRQRGVWGEHTQEKAQGGGGGPTASPEGSAQSASLPGPPGLWLAAPLGRGGRLALAWTAVFSKWWLRRYRICLQCRRPRFAPWVRKILWRRKGQPAPVFLPGESHRQRSLAGYIQSTGS